MYRSLVAACCLVVLAASPAMSEIKTRDITYEHDGVTLHGHLAWDDALEGKRPAVLVVHEWWGLNAYARKRAEQLAKLGYLAFALDMYGEGKVADHPQQAGEWASQVRANVATWRGRALAGLKQLQSHPLADADRTAAIGYCFGGATVLQLAYANAPLRGVVSFHGALPAPPQDQSIQPKILVCHGAADSFITDEAIQQFQSGLEKLQADWQMIYYGQARHSFTNPAADQRGIDGLKYNAAADRRSWQHMQLFFDELFAQ